MTYEISKQIRIYNNEMTTKLPPKVGHEFYVIMVQRRDGEVYCDLAKTNQQIYLTKEDAQENLKDYPHHHIVKMIAYLDEDL